MNLTSLYFIYWNKNILYYAYTYVLQSIIILVTECRLFSIKPYLVEQNKLYALECKAPKRIVWYCDDSYLLTMTLVSTLSIKLCMFVCTYSSQLNTNIYMYIKNSYIRKKFEDLQLGHLHVCILLCIFNLLPVRVDTEPRKDIVPPH